MAVMIVSDSNWGVMEHGVFCSNLHIFEPHFAFVWGRHFRCWLRPFRLLHELPERPRASHTKLRIWKSVQDRKLS